MRPASTVSSRAASRSSPEPCGRSRRGRQTPPRTGLPVKECVYSPHSLRAPTATLLLGTGVDIRKIQDLLCHRHVTTTQTYGKRRIAVREASS